MQKAQEQNKAKKQGAKFYLTSLEHIDSTPNITGHEVEGSSGSELQLNQEERERVIEILLGQEKVVALLYDRPPADATSNFSLKQQHTEGVMSSFNK